MLKILTPFAALLMLSGCVDTYAQAYGKCAGDEDCIQTRIMNQQAVQAAAIAAIAGAAAGAAAGYAGSRGVRHYYVGRPVIVVPAVGLED